MYWSVKDMINMGDQFYSIATFTKHLCLRLSEILLHIWQNNTESQATTEMTKYTLEVFLLCV